MSRLKDKRILVTGACGTIGVELVRQLLTDEQHAPAAVVGIDNNESELFYLDQQYFPDPRASFFVADIRDVNACALRMRDIDVVFHTAALKHVVLCERSPFEAVQTNIHGVKNIITTAQQYDIDSVIFTTSDKAVNPTNVMGTSKLMGERIMTAANNERPGKGPIFASTRFGNVLGSNGSVIPIFHRQIYLGGPVTLTDPKMTRFVMTAKQAVKLILDSAEVARGGEVFVTKMPVIRIADLAQVMIEELGPRYGHDPDKIGIKHIGVKPGEKLYEELMNDEETRRAMELEDYFAIMPAFRGLYRKIDYKYNNIVADQVTAPYVSSEDNAMDVETLREFLTSERLLDAHAFDRLHRPEQRYWPGEDGE